MSNLNNVTPSLGNKCSQKSSFVMFERIPLSFVEWLFMMITAVLIDSKLELRFRQKCCLSVQLEKMGNFEKIMFLILQCSIAC